VCLKVSSGSNGRADAVWGAGASARSGGGGVGNPVDSLPIAQHAASTEVSARPLRQRAKTSSHVCQFPRVTESWHDTRADDESGTMRQQRPSREKQAEYRTLQRSRGLCEVSTWVPEEAREVLKKVVSEGRFESLQAAYAEGIIRLSQENSNQRT